jgi:hypothetical protein
MTTTDLLRARLDALAAAAQTGADALADGPALDLSPEVVAELVLELETLAGRLELVLDRLSAAVDPVGACSRPAVGAEGDA